MTEQRGNTSAVRTGHLVVRGLHAGYPGLPVLFGIDLDVGPGEVVVLLGHNGAGKTTLVRALSGELRATAGTIELAGTGDVVSWPASRRHRHGLRVVRQDRPVFGELSVSKNLRLAGVPDLAAAEAFFGFLGSRGQQQAGALSGGEQKMLAIARTLAAPGLVCVFDEATEGLQPANVELFVAAARTAADNGQAVLLVEQHIDAALSVADRWHLLEKGEVIDGGLVGAGTAARVAARLAP